MRSSPSPLESGPASPLPALQRGASRSSQRSSTRRNPCRSRRSLSIVLCFAVAFAVATTSLVTGCSVMDEMDKAAAKLPTKGKPGDPKGGAGGKPTDAAARLAAARSQASQNAKKWWSQAKTMTPGQRPEGIVQCSIAGELRFMSREDCVVQGGAPREGTS